MIWKEMAPPGTAGSGKKGLTARAVRGAVMTKKVSKKLAEKRKKRRKRLAQFLEKDRYIYNDLLRRSGSIVFSSSKGAEYSHETPIWKNGIFTEVIVQCLAEGREDRNGDGIISTNELRRYVSKKVPKVVSKIRYPGEPKTIPQQHPTVDRDNIYQKFGFPVVR